MKRLEAQFMTPAETILKLSGTIIEERDAAIAAGASHHYNRLNYKKTRELLRLALTDQLGELTIDQRTRVSDAIDKLDELFKKRRAITRRAWMKNAPEFNL